MPRGLDKTSISCRNNSLYHSHAPNPGFYGQNQDIPGIVNVEGYWKTIGYKDKLSDFIKTEEEASEIVKNIIKTKQRMTVQIAPKNSNTLIRKQIEFYPQIQRPKFIFSKHYYYKLGSITEGVLFHSNFNNNIIKHIAKKLNIDIRGIDGRSSTFKSGPALSQQNKFCDYPKPFINKHKCIHKFKKFFPRGKYKV